ncbi:hypothetical protein E4T44_04844 [Aureobasidium sp. EXF-8845]|nr:hypothetical protein E4T44_04844 [Aureobasidium sp. EXF-8845]KAI4852253.1 hypothetical protein E4T45_04779 [Aureobasidium sp. EXF-8846]
MGKSKDLLVSTIADLHASGAYSDLKIVCGSDTYNVHKAIICPQSKFFRAACRPDAFQEGKTGIVTIPFNPGRDTSTMEAPIKPNEFDWDLDVEDASVVKLMIHYFYHHEYPSETYTEIKDVDMTARNLSKGVLVVHSKMYAMGEKYQVPALKALAERKFDKCWSKTNAGFCTAIVIAFMSTSEMDQGLRKKIVGMINIRTSVTTVRSKILDDTIRQIPELVYALYRKLLEERKK